MIVNILSIRLKVQKKPQKRTSPLKMVVTKNTHIMTCRNSPRKLVTQAVLLTDVYLNLLTLTPHSVISCVELN